ncbi:MAG: hypothetical protein HZA80_00095 [Candidatus Taylorbacteria bacterium]|nr:hypothetical protein [Candidatus Taylorbacteria bacterium]
MKNIFPQQKNGYTLLFAVLVTSLVLSVAVSILNITRKESILASAARESQSAIYAADTGIECVVYQYQAGAFSTASQALPTLPSPSQPADVQTSNFFCGGLGYTVTGKGFTRNVQTSSNGTFSVTPAYKYDFDINLSSTNTGKAETTCAKVSITRGYAWDGTSNTNYENIVVESRGYSAGWVTTGSGSCTGSSPKKVERAIRLKL